MKLYIKPGACSLAPHIALCEAGYDVETIAVDLAAKTLPDGSSYLDVNPRGQVPALALKSGRILTEAAVILQYIADQNPGAHLLPGYGTEDRYFTLAWLNWVSTELHKRFGPLFTPGTSEEAKQAARDGLVQQFAKLEARLVESNYLAQTGYSIADMYCFVVLGWAQHVGLDLSGFPRVLSYQARIAERPAVQQALREEGLL